MKLSEYIEREVRTSPKESKLKIMLKHRIEPQFNAIWLLRKAQCSKNKIFRYLYRRSLVKKYGIFIGDRTEIGIGFKMGHPNSIIIGEGVVIGENCTVFQQTTIGIKRNSGGGYPIIGNNCIIYAGAKIIGPVEIGDNSIVGANAVVTHSCPPNSILKGVPARCTERKK